MAWDSIRQNLTPHYSSRQSSRCKAVMNQRITGSHCSPSA
ncbi:hypothetical protein BIFDEN_01867 [Bifidobacterium dentium ATCC 27678]|nr:hypothetical protein BIFDEN_01867 [Bifidobacterium dentium ATCC 27678]